MWVENQDVVLAPSCRSNLEALAGVMVEVYEKTRSKFTIDEFSHYQFTPRDLTLWWSPSVLWSTGVHFFSFVLCRLFMGVVVWNGCQRDGDSSRPSFSDGGFYLCLLIVGCETCG